jgi:sugar transferase (PEP-CTERM system associated)
VAVIKIFDHYFHKRTLFQMLMDFMLVLGVIIFAIAMQANDWALAADSSWRSAFSASILFAAGTLVINGSLGFYQRIHSRTAGQSGSRALLSLILLLPLAYVIFNISNFKLDDGKLFLAFMLLGVALILQHRVHVIHTMAIDESRQRVLIFGAGARAKSVGTSLLKSDANVDLVGYYAVPTESVVEGAEPSLSAGGLSLMRVVQEKRVDEIIVTLSERRGGILPLRDLLDCKLTGVRVLDIATHFERTLGQIRLDSLSAGWLVFGDGFDQGLLRAINKRIFDVVCSLILIVLTLPVMLVTAMLIALESKGPVFYSQERVGLSGQPFKVVKFRSMRTDAEKDGTPRWASANDDRITRVGRIIRKTRIDELPQLFGVLGGRMSLVGPRPERQFFVDQLTKDIPFYAVRHSVKPGVTGWAQVKYQYGASMEDAAEKLQYDLYYVKNHTLFLDLIVLFETVGVVLMRKGAQ